MKTEFWINFSSFIILIIFVFLCFWTDKNQNLSSIKFLILNNSQFEYVNLSEICERLDFCIENDQFQIKESYPLNDINTRLLEDSIETLSYVKNAEVYLSLHNELTIFIEQEKPFIKTVIDNEICFLSQNDVKLKLINGKLPQVLFFSGDVQLESIKDVFYLATSLYSDKFLYSIIQEVNYNRKTGYVLYSDFFDFGIEIGHVNQLSQKFQKIKKFFSSIVRDVKLSEQGILNIKKLNVSYDKQLICIM